MKKHVLNRGLLITAIIALVGFSSIALAGPNAPGRHMRGDGADCPRFAEGRGAGWGANLSDTQIAQLDKLRSDFHAATADLRGELRQKELALKAELAKKTPDSAAAMALQKEISALSADLDARRLAHRLEVHQIAPEAGWGAGRGPGAHHGKGGRGPCWN